MTEKYTPDEAGARLAYVDGLFASGTRNIKEQREELRAEFDRFLAKVRADAWSEGYETGCSSPYGTATPSGKPYDPEPNPYRIEEEA